LQDPPDWHEILAYFHGSELQNYFKRMVEDNLKPIMKPQVEIMHKNRNSFQVSVGQLLDRKDERGMKDQLCNGLQLNEVIDRKVAKLSGGELQRVGIAAAALQSADVYMFDEPSSYLDVKQRLNAARVIKSLLRTNSYVIVVEHDLSVLDYMSDYICCLYG
jgi:ATP-binding cassette subfamily E protein 1